MILRGKNLSETNPVTTWREVLHPKKALVWARLADGPNDAVAINWFHSQNHGPGIKETSLTGKVGVVGHLWNRMYPLQDSASSAGSAGDTQHRKPAADPFAKPVNPLERATRPGASRFAQPPSRLERQSRRIKINQFWRGQYLETLTFFNNAHDKTIENNFLDYMSNRAHHEWGFQRIDYSES